jgi:hypothetical protein
MAALLLVLNDHVLKEAFPGFVTGKLSDVAGMILAPLVLATAVERVSPVSLRGAPVFLRAARYGSVVAVACAFALVKTWPPATDLYAAAVTAARAPLRALLALTLDRPPWSERIPVVRDATDLATIPFGFAGAWLVTASALGRGARRRDGPRPLGRTPARRTQS